MIETIVRGRNKTFEVAKTVALDFLGLNEPINIINENFRRYSLREALKYDAFIVLAPLFIGGLVGAISENAPVGVISALTMYTLEGMTLVRAKHDRSYLGEGSSEELMGINLREEAKYFSERDNHRGIQWDFMRGTDAELGDFNFSRIECGINQENEQVLKVNSLSNSTWPVSRKPSPEEIAKFVLVADYVAPRSSHTHRLRSLALARLIDEENKLKALKGIII